MERDRIRETTQRWCARHPVLAGLFLGGVWPLLFLTSANPSLGETLVSYAAFASLFTLVAFNERRRRKKMNQKH